MFRVKQFITADVITVEPDWLWQGKQGNKVIVFGYTTPEPNMVGYDFAKKKLEALLKDKQIELRNPTFYPNLGYDVLICSIYLDGVDIANYFPEFTGRVMR